MHKLTKREGEEFIKSQNYDIILSAKIDNWSAEEETVYFPVSKKEFIKDIYEELIVWTKEGEIIGDFTMDWEETLINILQCSDDCEKEFIDFCRKKDIKWDEWVD